MQSRSLSIKKFCICRSIWLQGITKTPVNLQLVKFVTFLESNKMKINGLKSAFLSLQNDKAVLID